MSDEQLAENELSALIAELERVGLVEPHRRDDGRIAYRLTQEGSRLGRMLHTAGADAVLGMLEDVRFYGRRPESGDARGSGSPV
jgi:hypothetical protein